MVDASVGLKWLVEQAGSDAAVALVAGRALVTSTLFWAEAANALATKERHGEPDRAGMEDAGRDLAQAPLEIAPLDLACAAAALALAAELEAPGLDCCCLELALTRGTVVVPPIGASEAGRAARDPCDPGRATSARSSFGGGEAGLAGAAPAPERLVSLDEGGAPWTRAASAPAG